ncbi:MAG TPA: glycoside hydrolase family 125 protein [Gaiellaceae bacterium]
MTVPVANRPVLDRIVSGSLAYVRGCTTLRISPDEVCILTDHRILQLSWTRDGYYQALLLLRTGAGDDAALVADHLRWLWGRCRRPERLWMRSHLPNGEPKDLVFQADQQLYPLLELADYRETTGAWPDPPRGTSWPRLVDELWAALPVDEGLVPSDENPADDSAQLPFALSTQILYWHTAQRLGHLAEELGTRTDFAAATRATPRAIEEHFAADGPLGPQWAYETNRAGEHRLYHDANDVPTALAPSWGFCEPSDPRWAGTMRFAFSAHNPGYSPGRLGGLGSLHTPGTWPLGDIQEWIAMRQLGDREAAARALTRLESVASSDGMLPEAYDSDSGEWLARHWFAWPGALLGALLANGSHACGR